jgi:hypothetical protein
MWMSLTVKLRNDIQLILVKTNYKGQQKFDRYNH